MKQRVDGLIRRETNPRRWFAFHYCLGLIASLFLLSGVELLCSYPVWIPGKTILGLLVGPLLLVLLARRIDGDACG